MGRRPREPRVDRNLGTHKFSSLACTRMRDMPQPGLPNPGHLLGLLLLPGIVKSLSYVKQQPKSLHECGGNLATVIIK